MELHLVLPPIGVVVVVVVVVVVCGVCVFLVKGQGLGILHKFEVEKWMCNAKELVTMRVLPMRGLLKTWGICVCVCVCKPIGSLTLSILYFFIHILTYPLHEPCQDV